LLLTLFFLFLSCHVIAAIAYDAPFLLLMPAHYLLLFAISLAFAFLLRSVYAPFAGDVMLRAQMLVCALSDDFGAR